MPPKINQSERGEQPEQESEFSYHGEEGVGSGESVKVALRLRPPNNTETMRGDSSIVVASDRNNCQLLHK